MFGRPVHFYLRTWLLLPLRQPLLVLHPTSRLSSLTMVVMAMIAMNNVKIKMALAQIPISTFSHIWVFVCHYGIMFVIIVIAIIIIIIIKSEGVNAQL